MNNGTPGFQGLGNRSASQGMFRRLERMEEEMDASLVNTGSTRWMIPYADMLTLLLGLFLVLLSIVQADYTTLQGYSQQVKDSLSSEYAEPEKASALLAQGEGEGGALETSVEEPLDTLEPVVAQEPMAMLMLEEQIQAQLDDALPDVRQDVSVFHEARGVVISLKDTLLFHPGEAELTPKALQALDGLVGAVVQSDRQIRVEGHTDTTPITTAQFPSNWELSTARATNIVKYLVTQHQVDPQKLSAAGYGEFRPMAENETVEGRQRNRRVDIVVLNEQGAQYEPHQTSEEAQTDAAP